MAGDLRVRVQTPASKATFDCLVAQRKYKAPVMIYSDR